MRVESRVYVLTRGLSPVHLLLQLQIGESIRNLSVAVEDGFNDPAATISIGTLALPELLIRKVESVLQVAGEYRSAETYITAPSAIQIYVFLEPKGSTSGIARLFFDVALGPVS